MRDRVKHKVGKYFYAILCLGWRGSGRQWANYEFCYLMLAGIATLLVITNPAPWSRAISRPPSCPGWHGTIFIPYFGVGAIYGGFCMLIILLVPIRQYYKLQDLVTLRHIDMCCRFTLLMGLFVAYIYGMEFFIAYLGGSPNERFTFYDRVRGPLLADLVRNDVLQLRRAAAFLDEERAPQPVAGLRRRSVSQRRHVARALRHHRQLGPPRLPPVFVGHVLPDLDRHHQPSPEPSACSS